MTNEGDGSPSDPRWESLRPLMEERFAGFLDQLTEGFQANLFLTNDEDVRALNAKFRGKDAPTNVLAFPTPSEFQAALGLGDVVLSYDRLAQEASAQEKSLADHATHLMLHGLLHLLGHDHGHEDEAAQMEETERMILAGLGIPDPYDGGVVA